MFVLLTSAWRRRAAALVAALYAMCLLVPGAAFALSDQPVPAHCLTVADEHGAQGDQQAMVDHHAHQHSGIDHGQSAPGHDHGLPDKCCGLFSVTAIAPAFDLVAAPALQADDVAMPLAASLIGRDAGRIDRPPRHLSAI